MGSTELLAVIENWRAKRIVIVGDVMLDEYLWGTVSRISPEAPVPVVEIKNQTVRPGGAANVAANIKALGAEPLLVGVVGSDPAARLLRDALKSQDIDDGGLVTDPDRPTTLKTRIIAHNQQVVRADREFTGPIPPAVEDALLDRLEGILGGADAVIFEDYNKGVLTPRVIAEAKARAGRRGLLRTVDPKLEQFFEYGGVELIKPNLREAEAALGRRLSGYEDVAAAGQALLERLRCASLVITMGERGMVLFRPGTAPEVVPAVGRREVRDVTGAGDTTIAALTLGLAAGASLVQAARVAAVAASLVVGKVGAVPVALEELVGAVRELGEAGELPA
jgi:rfaE bifunctional protein kinase chain/domain